MTYNVYTVYDKIACEAGPPFLAKNDDVARRNYANMVNGQKINVSDYALYRIGRFSNEDMFIMSENPVYIELLPSAMVTSFERGDA